MKSVCWISVLLLLALSLKGISSQINNDYKIIAQNESSLIIEYSPEYFIFDTVTVNHQKYLKPNFYQASWVNKAGEPQLPARIFTLGVPPSGKATLNILSFDYKTIVGVRILPVAGLEKEEEFYREVYEEGDAYKQASLMPEEVAELVDPGFIRNQSVITLKISPIQYNPVQNRVLVYNKIKVRIVFSGKAVADTPIRRKTGRETLLDRGLLNNKQAKKWRIAEPVPKTTIHRSGLSGYRYKIPIKEEGIYKLTGKFLSDEGVDISSLDPETIKIYNNGGKQLPRDIYAERPAGLLENPILVYGTEDSSFDESDYILFYGKGTSGWEFTQNQQEYEHYLNIYDETNIYFLVFNDGTAGRRMKVIDNAGMTGTNNLSTARQKIFLENDMYNLLKAGIDWYGNEFSPNHPNKQYQLLLDYPVLNSTLEFSFKFKGGNSVYHQFRIELNQEQIKTFNFYSMSEYTTSAVFSGSYDNGSNELDIEYLTGSDGARAYLDWYEVEYPCQLKSLEGKLSFFASRTPGIYTYHLSNFDQQPLVLDITEVTEVRQMALSAYEKEWTFSDSVTQDRIPRYYAGEESAYKVPSQITADEASQLRNPSHQADLLVITHEDFYDQALRFASHREQNDSISVFVCDIQDVYDEFNSGLLDPVAIRDFVKYCYDYWAKSPSLLLLFGDGDYDYRNILYNNDKNWIPPFEYDGTNSDRARATDDWFTYVSGNDIYMDLAVGRFPVRTVQEAEAVVDKIIQYESNPDFGWWRNLFTLVGDDEFGGPGNDYEVTHINASEDIAENVIPDKYELRKIYLTEYPEVFSRKPAAQTDFIDQINQGTVWVNFIGHGNHTDLAHERVFERDKNIKMLNNTQKLCFFYAATCHFGQYDIPNDQSAAELLLTSTEGIGSIGCIAASRACNPDPNEALNKQMLNKLLNSDNPLRMGEALAIAKNNNIGFSENNQMYILFGDPSMYLGVPTLKSVITDIQPDTLKALDKFTVKGRIEKQGKAWTDFKGNVFLQCYDSKKQIVYIGDEVELNYALSGNSLFRGQKEITGGEFEFSFIIPKDISYGGTTARISTYFYDKQWDGDGSKELLPVGGSADLVDLEGPEITLYFTGYENFITGDMVEEDPELVASLKDNKSGVNITEEIGHKIMLYVDDQNPVNITENFQYDKDSYLAGSLQYSLSGLSTGDHTVILKAWDNANNSAQKSIDFEIVPQDELRIEEVLNYPNPMQNSTYFTFKLNKDAEIEIKIYTVSGKLVYALTSLSGLTGFNMIPWDGTDGMGDPIANGVYLYKVKARSYDSESSSKKEKIGKLIIMR